MSVTGVHHAWGYGANATAAVPPGSAIWAEVAGARIDLTHRAAWLLLTPAGQVTPAVVVHAPGARFWVGGQPLDPALACAQIGAAVADAAWRAAARAHQGRQ